MKTYEVELKFRVRDFDQILSRLELIGAISHSPVDQEDRYMAHPGRDFAQTGEALRLRRDGAKNRITYKGAKLGGIAKTREELEITFADGMENLDKLAQLFSALGFAPVASVRKHRREFEVERDGRTYHLALDEAENLGSFAEVETLALDSDDLRQAQEGVHALAVELGLTDIEPRSYLRMLLEFQDRLTP